MSHWQDISTAPKDVEILATNKEETLVTSWVGAGVGWYYSGDCLRGFADWDPTHWMPLPEPPK